LKIASGSIVGICGPSGEGKTTFIDLLVGLYPPQSGEILVGNVVLSGAALNAWRDRVSYVTQDAFLFHDTIRRNLLWAAPKSREEDLWSVLRLAGADGLVKKMAAGLDTVVGERGTLVSGGERQRLALARAVLRKPHLLVLDEATNALDMASERAILQRLAGLFPRPTIIMIAHRVDSVRLCERVITLEGGRFVEGRP
jgi:ATP-binding cassette subfamily C protein